MAREPFVVNVDSGRNISDSKHRILVKIALDDPSILYGELLIESHAESEDCGSFAKELN